MLPECCQIGFFWFRLVEPIAIKSLAWLPGAGMAGISIASGLDCQTEAPTHGIHRHNIVLELETVLPQFVQKFFLG